MTTELDLHPAPTLWGYSADSCPTVEKPADWQLARLAVQAGDFLAQHTRRPTPFENPPRTPAGMGSLVRNGWVRARGWHRIVPTDGPPWHTALDPELVARRITSGAAAASGLRALIDKVARIRRRPYGLPDGAALTITVPHLPDEWWRYLASGWMSTLIGAPGRSITAPLPDPRPSRDLADAMQWLQEKEELGVVREAFHDPERALVEDALAAMPYDVPGAHDGARLTTLTRLLSLYSQADEHGDQPLADFVASIRPPL